MLPVTEKIERRRKRERNQAGRILPLDVEETTTSMGFKNYYLFLYRVLNVKRNVRGGGGGGWD
jgi:hypothetical protein